MLVLVFAAAGMSPKPSDGSHRIVTERPYELIPDVDEWVLLTPGVEANLRSVRKFYGPRGEKTGMATRHAQTKITRVSKVVIALTGVAATGAVGSVTKAGGRPPTSPSADRKAAQTLGVTPEAVNAAARALWGHGLAAERDRRIGDPAATAQKRGRVTRQLIAELKHTIKPRRT